MRKYIAIIFLVCANVLMLAHSAIAHHHHNGVAVAIINNADLDDSHHHDHDTHDHHHHDQTDHSDTNHSDNHHGDTNEDCNLSNYTQLRKEYKQTINIALFCHIAKQYILLVDDSEGEESHYNGFLEHRYKSPHLVSQPLRGPPIC